MSQNNLFPVVRPLFRGRMFQINPSPVERMLLKAMCLTGHMSQDTHSTLCWDVILFEHMLKEEDSLWTTSGSLDKCLIA